MTRRTVLGMAVGAALAVALPAALAGSAADPGVTPTTIVLGGTSLLGGEGAIWRSVLGAFFLQMIGNGFNLLGTTPEAQYVIKGVILAAAVAVDAWARRARQ